MTSGVARESAGAKKRKRRWPLVLGVGFGGLVLIQLIPVPRTNPPVQASPAWDSPRTRELARRACMDCHSHDTKWPWYSRVAPASWLVAYDVIEGREAFNVSLPEPGEAHEAADTVAEGEMPPWQYTLAHPEARLTEAERNELIAGLRATFGRGEGSGGERGEGDED